MKIEVQMGIFFCSGGCQVQSRKMKTSPFQNNFCLKNCINIDDKNQEILSSILDKYDLPK